MSLRVPHPTDAEFFRESFDWRGYCLAFKQWKTRIRELREQYAQSGKVELANLLGQILGE